MENRAHPPDLGVPGMTRISTVVVAAIAVLVLLTMTVPAEAHYSIKPPSRPCKALEFEYGTDFAAFDIRVTNMTCRRVTGIAISRATLPEIKQLSPFRCVKRFRHGDRDDGIGPHRLPPPHDCWLRGGRVRRMWKIESYEDDLAHTSTKAALRTTARSRSCGSADSSSCGYATSWSTSRIAS